jgi:GNAT superfamily N-acetyltransferase
MKNESVRKLSPSDSKALKGFVELERKLVGSNPLFVSELDRDVIRHLSGKSVLCRMMKRQLFVVSDGRQDVARCAALINPAYQKAKNEAVGFIGYFAAAPNSLPQVQAMLEQAELWLRERGVTRVIAPHNGASVLNYGCLTAAFDEEPVIPFGWQPSYYSEYISASGYSPTYPIMCYSVSFLTDQWKAIAQRVPENNELFRVRPISKKHWDSEVETFREIFNKVFVDEWEVHPYTSEEFREFFGEFKLLVGGSFQIFIAEVDEKPVGIAMVLPDLNPLIRPLRGKLGPSQIIRLLLNLRRYTQHPKRVGMYIIGALPEYQRKGLAHVITITAGRFYERRYGLTGGSGTLVNKSNVRSCRFIESLGGTGRVLYHCYDKRLS